MYLRSIVTFAVFAGSFSYVCAQRHYELRQNYELPWIGATGPSAEMPSVGGAVSKTWNGYDIFLDGNPVDIQSIFTGEITASSIRSLTVSRDGSIAGTASGKINSSGVPIYAFDIRSQSHDLSLIGNIDNFRGIGEKIASNYHGVMAVYDCETWGSTIWDGMKILETDAPNYETGVIGSGGHIKIQDRFSPDGKLYFSVNRFDFDLGVTREFSYMYDSVANTEFDFNKIFGNVNSYVSGPDKRGYVGVTTTSKIYGQSGFHYEAQLFDGTSIHEIDELNSTGWFSTTIAGITNEGDIFGFYEVNEGEEYSGYILSHGSIYQMKDYIDNPIGYLTFTGKFYDNGVIEVYDRSKQQNAFLVPTVPEPSPWILLGGASVLLIRKRRVNSSA